MEDMLKVSKILNLVYDDWPPEKEFPLSNRPKYMIDDLSRMWMPSYITIEGAFPGVRLNNYRIEDVRKFPNLKFFYHIWHRTSLYYDFFSKGLLPIDDTIINLITEVNNFNLIFMSETEFESKECLKLLNDILIEKKISPSKVWVLNNNPKLKLWKEEINTEINVHSCRTMPKLLKSEPLSVFKPTKDEKNFFLCHNRSPRSHRYALLCLLKHYNILEDTNWSLINGWQSDKINKLNKYFSVFSETDLVSLKNEINYFETIDTVKSKYELNEIYFDNRENQEFFNKVATYENSYINLVTETNFEDEAIHITEKSLKPFYYLQIPLILASYEHNKYVKSVYGFDMFDDIINYDYDSIKNNRQRLFAYVNEVERLHKNKNKIIKFYENNKDRFIKNREIIINYENKHDYSFFETLASGE